MKNQGVWVTRIIMLAIFTFVMAYMGYHVVSALSAPIRTNTAILYKTEETVPFSGLVVREEAVVELPSGSMEFRVAEGERVAKNQVIAVTYSDPFAVQVYGELRELEARLEQLVYVESHSESAVSASELEESIRESLSGVMSLASAGRIRELRENALELKSSLFRREYAYGNLAVVSEAVDELNLRIESLRKQASSAESQVRSPAAGLFSPRTDGLEDRLSPASMGGLSSEEIRELLKTAESSLYTGRGKMVYGINWYIVAELTEDAAPTEGSAIELRLSDGHELRMTVHSSKRQDGGMCIVTFSCSGELARIVSERQMSGEIILSKSEGIRVPKEAIQSDDEGVFVYCAVLSQVRRKPVTIIHEVDRENYFLVEYAPGNSAHLLPGDEMIVAGKGLFDGKVLG